jgi:hypothetical protein
MNNPEKQATYGTQDEDKKTKYTTQYMCKQRGLVIGNKGNNKITELRTILQRESQNS